MMTHQDIAQHQQVTDSTHGTNMVTRKQKNHRHTWLSVNKGKHNKQKYVLYTVIGSPTPARDKVGGCCDGQSSPVLGGCSAGLPRWRGGAVMMVARLVAPPLHRHHTSGACGPATISGSGASNGGLTNSGGAWSAGEMVALGGAMTMQEPPPVPASRRRQSSRHTAACRAPAAGSPTSGCASAPVCDPRPQRPPPSPLPSLCGLSHCNGARSIPVCSGACTF